MSFGRLGTLGTGFGKLGSSISAGEPLGPAPTIAITAGSGYYGSTYTATPGDDSTGGQWYQDGNAISGETGLTYTMSAEYEGDTITFRQADDNQASNGIQMWIPSDIGSALHWHDGVNQDYMALDGVDGVITLSDIIGSWDWTQASESDRPNPTGDGLDIESGEHLEIPAAADAAANFKWMQLVFSADPSSFPSNRIYFTINSDAGSGFKVWTGAAADNIRVNVRDQADNLIDVIAAAGLSEAVFSCCSRIIAADGDLRVSFNGGTETVTAASITSLYTTTAASVLGGFANPWDFMALIIGSGDLANDDMDKLQGWAYHRHGGSIQAGHTYESVPPFADGFEP